MPDTSVERRYTPLIILLLVAALVATLAMWAVERAGAERGARQQHATADAGGGGEQKHYQWKMVTTWPKNFPGLGMAAENFADLVELMSDGRLKVHVYGAGELVPAMEVFDAVSQGVVDAGHGAAYYWKGKVPSAVFFTSMPFGLNAQEMNGWLHYGGGLELWQEAYAPYNLVPMAGGSTGV
jgi:TRAP-type mannitol/chloroaromatic compound transport system substrate-binding protein